VAEQPVFIKTQLEWVTRNDAENYIFLLYTLTAHFWIIQTYYAYSTSEFLINLLELASQTQDFWSSGLFKNLTNTSNSDAFSAVSNQSSSEISSDLQTASSRALTFSSEGKAMNI